MQSATRPLILPLLQKLVYSVPTAQLKATMVVNGGAMDSDIRWKQRFQNFDRAVTLLDEALKKGPGALSLLEKEGVIRRFEYSFELAWKTVKDYLFEGGLIVSPVTPRQVLKEAYGAKLMRDGQVWIDMLDHRNLLSHTYDNAVFNEAAQAVADRYLPAMKELHAFFSKEVNG